MDLKPENIGVQPTDNVNAHARKVLGETSAAAVVLLLVSEEGVQIAAVGRMMFPAEMLLQVLRDSADSIERDLALKAGTIKPS